MLVSFAFSITCVLWAFWRLISLGGCGSGCMYHGLLWDFSILAAFFCSRCGFGRVSGWFDLVVSVLKLRFEYFE